ncbi:MAG: hypothetical protein GY715_00650 [Planctomycetes bacterium]|nr:hypothetical protein [Planctomycetota bacterium]
MNANVVCLGVPFVIAPILVLCLRPLFSLFLEEGLVLFTDRLVNHDQTAYLAGRLAAANVLFLLAVWTISFSCAMLDVPLALSAIPTLVGVPVALAVTVLMVRKRVGLDRRHAMLVGLLAFAGGNLPLFLLVPTILALQ